MTLVLVLVLAVAAVSCGREGGGDDDDSIGADGDADADGDGDSDAELLQVDLQYTTSCEAGGCATIDHALAGRNGDELPAGGGAVLGIECEIDGSADPPVLTSLRVQDRPIGVDPGDGIGIDSGTLVLGSAMTCAAESVHLFQASEHVGGCAGLTDGSCAILVNDYDEARALFVLQLDCQNLAPRVGTTARSLRDGLLTIQGCSLR